jgi:predicted nucleic acid-binding protein
MTSTPLVVLDACVLANFSLCDTLLRLAEPPRLFEPKWSEEIIRETTRTLELKLGWPNSLTAHLEKELRAHFSEAWISGYESLIPMMTNDEKDRHVVAAAVHGEAAIILTLNLRHFRPEHLANVACPRAAPSVLSDRDLPPGTSRGIDETRAAGS